ncbi:MAG: hypothetical protein R3E97_05295 [Candidatus Eisenbacteria bacterium]
MVDFGRWEIVWKGLYPRIHDQSLDPNHWYPDYFRTYVERDLRAVLRVADLTALNDSFSSWLHAPGRS